jgi:hypothetical protein
MATRCGGTPYRTSVSTYSPGTGRRTIADEYSRGVTATRSDAIERVSTLELFFDLVFVFTITQLTCGSMWSWRRDRF